MSVQQAGADIRVLRELEDFPLAYRSRHEPVFKPGAYLRTHAEHMQRWHGEQHGG
ncbi:MAG TPA: hypothetical protein VFX25_38575 [Streptosporangiaceae bacterium]|nr:hypothetical protein [Streptosporangiaceae bacterium]